MWNGHRAKLACLAADGKLAENEPWIQEGIVGSRFVGTYRRAGDQIIPTVTGTAHITAETSLVLDSSDPFCWGLSSHQA